MLKDKDFLTAREGFSKHAAKNRGSCTCVGWFTNEGKYVEDKNPQCHIGLNYYRASGTPLVIFSGFQRNHRNNTDKKALGEAWFKYQKAHPIWGKAVLNEDFEDVYENGWMFSTDHPRNTLCSAIFATRWPTEHPAQCRSFVEYVKAGMQPDMAFVLSTISSYAEGDKMVEFQYKSGHMPCWEGAPSSFVKSFLSYTTAKEDVSYKESPGYAYIDKVFPAGNVSYENTGRASPLSLRLKESLSEEVGYRPSRDIFYTRKVYEREMAKAGNPDWSIPIKELPQVAAAMNKYREEILA